METRPPRKHPDNQTGNLPTRFFRHMTKPQCWDMASRLRKKPQKISAYFEKVVISEARKLRGSVSSPDIFFLKLTDGSYLEIEY